jgi:hypothetical protein
VEDALPQMPFRLQPISVVQAPIGAHARIAAIIIFACAAFSL